MDYSEYYLRIKALLRMLQDACNSGDYASAYGLANEIEHQAKEMKNWLNGVRE